MGAETRPTNIMENQKSEAINDTRQPGLPPATCSASHDEADYYDDETDQNCHFCGGDGYMMGDELDDLDMYDADKVYKCPCCRGSGDAKDCTFG